MSGNRTHGVDQHASAERLEWLIQRIGWGIWALIVAAALAGLLGPGPLSSTSAISSDESLEVKYDRFVHAHHPITIELLLHGPARAEQAEIQITRTLLDAVQIRRIEPEPRRNALSTDGNVYTIPLEPDVSGAKVTIHLEYEKFGTVTGGIGLAGSSLLPLSQFVWP